jgi:DNA helicase-2/ATP-dependent DNA helicase PcrA
VRIIPVDDEDKEARGVVQDILQQVSVKKYALGECAILFRTATQPRAFEAALRARNVPYVLVGGQSFFDRKEVRDVLAYLKLLENPADEVALLRVVNCPPRGIGKGSLDKVLAEAARRSVPAADAFATAPIPEGARASFGLLRDRLGALAERRRMPLVECISALLEAVDYRAEVDRCYPDPRAREARWAGVQEVLNFAENYSRRTSKPTLQEFLEQLALADRDASGDEPKQRKDAVTLMTLHAAKGLEFPRVYLVGCEEGLLPHDKSMEGDGVEEERRLMYVGITRARRHLTITFAKNRAKFGRRADTMPSRFLFELKGEAPPKGWKPGRPRGAPTSAPPGSPASRGSRASPAPPAPQVPRGRPRRKRGAGESKGS